MVRSAHLCLLVAAALAIAPAPAPAAGRDAQLPRLHGGTVLYTDGYGAACRDATRDEMLEMLERDVPLEPIAASGAEKQGGGLTILLRGTQQLDEFPTARDAFVRAAAVWEDLLDSPVTMVLDVDFGPTRFGRPYPARVIGSTDPQYNPTQAVAFPAMRQALVERASSPDEAALYELLPETTVPTTEGPSLLVYAPVAVLRATGFEAPVADPVAERDRLGAPPSIGFNSAFDFDFDPDDGIGANQIDFHAVVLHEIGHALGFDSWSGASEYFPAASIVLTTWDLFRFRPGATIEEFATRPRVTLTGGEQVYFAGGAPLGLSTGGLGGQSGDGRQSSHWKDNRLTDAPVIGIMDPTLSDGEQISITESDLDALDKMGWRIDRGAPPAVESFAATADGDTVRVEATIADVDGDVDPETIALEVLDREGQRVGELARAAGGVTGTETQLRVSAIYSGLTAIPDAWFARLTVRDGRGFAAESGPVDLGLPDPAGPRVATAFFRPNKKLLRFTGTGYAGEVQLEVNGRFVLPRKVTANGAGTRLKAKGDAAALGIVPGTNTVRVYTNGLRSNVYTFVSR